DSASELGGYRWRCPDRDRFWQPLPHRSVGEKCGNDIAPSGHDQRPVTEDGGGAVEVRAAMRSRDPLLDRVNGEHPATGDLTVVLVGERDDGVLLALGLSLLLLGHVRHGARARRRRL